MSKTVRNQEAVAGILSEPSETLSRIALTILAVAALICAGLTLSFLSASPASAQSAQGQGGLIEAVRPLSSPTPNFKQMFQTWKQLDQVERGTIAIPSTMPVTGTRAGSGFGFRRSSMHFGIDLAGPLGTEIRATADGIVSRSKWVGAYGNLVEVNHGQGIQTRYGHMSKLLVMAGQRVKRGDVIGLMGSTGRSTGSHLHYEVRIDGKAVNPVAFIQSKEYLLAVQRRPADPTRIAMGGPAGGAK